VALQPAAASRPAGRHRAGRAPARLAARVALAAVLLAVAAGGGLAWGAVSRPEQPAAVPGGRPPPTAPPDWAGVLSRLDAGRAAAFARADAAALDAVYVPGSAPWRADRADVDALAARHAHATGVRHRVSSVRVISSSASQVRLRVVDRLPAYRVLDAAGHLLQAGAARADRAVTIVLDRWRGEWRIESIS
jgi:hypothetical protein